MEVIINKISTISTDLIPVFPESRTFTHCKDILLAIGAAYTLKTAIKGIWLAGRTVYNTCLARKIIFTKYGSWAIITGASEGIGRGYALELARQGLNIVLISRSEVKLQKVANEIKELYNREVRIVPVDFTQGQSVYDAVQAEISDLDVAVLVNNVGSCHSSLDVTGNRDKLELRNMIELNCQVMVQMTHLVLPKMVEKNAGIIVNISSVNGLAPIPYINVYSATKVFVRYFTDALRYEYKSHGIIVQGVYPGLVATRMVHMSRPSFYAPSPYAFTRRAVATIGIRDSTSVYWRHKLHGFLQSNLFSPGLSMRFSVFLWRLYALVIAPRHMQDQFD